MFAPLIVKPQARTGVRPSDKSTLRRAMTDNHDRDIEQEQTSQRAPQTGPRLFNNESAAVWDFSRIPLYPQGRRNGSERPSPTPAPRLPIQAKLEVGAVNDSLELEADRVADQVMRMPEVPATFTPMQISRKCAACEEEEEKLQKKDAGTAEAVPGEAPASVHEVLRSPGEPLDAATRAYFEPRFGYDFSRVRIHSDEQAGESAWDVNAVAYTAGHNIVFDGARFARGTHEGQRLLAHELTHVVQQSGGAVAIQRAPASDNRWKRDEKAARYRGQKMAKRIRAHGKLSKEARAKINSELGYFEGAAKEAYLKEVKPALLGVIEIEMPVEQKVPVPAKQKAPVLAELASEAPVLAELASEVEVTFLPALQGGREILTGGHEETPLEREEWEKLKQRELQEDEEINNDPAWSIKGGFCTKTPNGWRVYRQIVHYYQSESDKVPGAYFFTSDLFRDWCSGGMRKLRERWAKEESAVRINNEMDLLSIWLTVQGRERAELLISAAMALFPGQAPGGVRPRTSQVPRTVPPTRRFLPRPALSGPPAEFELPPAPARPGGQPAEPTSELNVPESTSTPPARAPVSPPPEPRRPAAGGPAEAGRMSEAMTEKEEAALQPETTVAAKGGKGSKGKTTKGEKETASSAKEAQKTSGGPTAQDKERIRQLAEWEKKNKVTGDVQGLQARLRSNDPETLKDAQAEFDQAKTAIENGQKWHVEEYGEGQGPKAPRSTRISTAEKSELENSGWLKKRLPAESDRREFMDWLKKGHKEGELGKELQPGQKETERHEHLHPGSREAEEKVREWERGKGRRRD